MEFAGSLRTQTAYDAIRNARRVREIARFNLPCSVRRHFEQLDSFPRWLIPIGDSVCRFNPVFGQGMSVAAQEAVVLGQLMEEPIRWRAWRRRSSPTSSLCSKRLGRRP